jgi:predicted DNA-binding transcriptional regulator AlpA
VPLFRRRPVPAAVSSLALPAGERRLAWAVTAEGEPVVAVRTGLLLPGRELLLWRQVESAVWERPLLRVREVAEVSGAGAEHRLELADEGDLPEVVRDRVTGSVAWATTATLSPHGGVRIVGRRVPDAELLEWQLVFDPGTDLSDPLVRAQAEHALQAARRSIG